MSEFEEYRNREANLTLAKKLTVGVWIVTVVVLALVGMMRLVTVELPEGVSLGFLPPFHALLNSCAAICLVLALKAIKGKRIEQHRGWIYVAMGCSLVFLLSYVTYHFTMPETVFGDTNGDGVLQNGEEEAAGVLRSIYLAVLLSHIALAALSLPFILMTFVYGFTNQFAKHRRAAKLVFPVWLYVAVTGPVVYLLLRPYY